MTGIHTRSEAHWIEPALNWVVSIAGMALCIWLAATDTKAILTTHDYDIVVVTDSTRISTNSKGKQAWLWDLQIDGRQADSLGVNVIGDWRKEPAPPYQFVTENPEHDTRLHWHGSTFSLKAIMSPWSGRIDVLRDGALLESVALTASKSKVVYIDISSNISLVPLLIAALAGVVGLFLLRPGCGGWRLAAWLAILLGFVHGMCWCTIPVGVTNDSPGYITAFDRFVEGCPYAYPPGYGMFIKLTAMFGCHPGLAVTIVQHALMVSLAVLLYRRFRNWTGESWAFLGALIGGVCYPTLFGAQAVMSETWTCFLMAATILLAMRNSVRSNYPRALAAGLTAAWAALSRVVPFVAVGAALLARGVLPWRKRNWRWVALAAGVAAVIPMAAVGQNGLRSGQWKLSTIVGRHLYNHFVYQQKLLDRDGPATKVFLSFLGQRDARDLQHWDVAEFIPANTAAEAEFREALFERVALEAAATTGIIHHLAFTSGLTWLNLSSSAVNYMAVEDEGKGDTPYLTHEPLFADKSRAKAMLSRNAELNAWIWPALCYLFVFALPGVFLLRDGHFEWLAWNGNVWIYMFVSSAIEFYLPRYHVAVSPMVAMMAIGSIGVLFRRCLTHVHHRSTKHPPNRFRADSLADCDR